eukprot:TRINITY_DN10081_c0_g1_i1.p1 TRINITY_DN10081_c0_g1~~TRINITY_DN10081_c0_g1_i1.p1  ORF type:complete len:110 (+),score=17.38 TRINITY_DN10081_c0_g1_i1:78-407(+)
MTENDEHQVKRPKVDADCEREGSPEAKDVGGIAKSPSPTRASPSPNLTPREPPVSSAVDRSKARSLSRKDELSPLRPPCISIADSRSNAPDRASVELPPSDSMEEPRAA